MILVQSIYWYVRIVKVGFKIKNGRYRAINGYSYSLWISELRVKICMPIYQKPYDPMIASIITSIPPEMNMPAADFIKVSL